MYLSQLILNPHSRHVQRDLTDRYELHRTLMIAFAEQLLDDERMLYRVEEDRHREHIALLVQSLERPNWDNSNRIMSQGYLRQPPRCRPIDLPPAATRTMFRLHANPTIKSEGRRHAIYGDERQANWLARQGERHGFSISLPHLRIVPLKQFHGQLGRGSRRQTWVGVQFDGELTVTDAALFTEALRTGIGSAKSFGFGLLSIPYRTA